MSHTIRNKTKLVNRVRRIQGQVEAIERALETGAECGEVLQRIAAARGAMNGLMSEVLEGHIHEHLLAPSAAAKDGTAFAGDLIDIVRAYLK